MFAEYQGLFEIMGCFSRKCAIKINLQVPSVMRIHHKITIALRAKVSERTAVYRTAASYNKACRWANSIAVATMPG